jgi:hypothetical protein
MTALIVKFDAQTIGAGGGVTARRQLRDGDGNEKETEQAGGAQGHAT